MCLMLTMSPAKERRSHALTLPFVMRRNDDEGAELLQWGFSFAEAKWPLVIG